MREAFPDAPRYDTKSGRTRLELLIRFAVTAIEAAIRNDIVNDTILGNRYHVVF